MTHRKVSFPLILSAAVMTGLSCVPAKAQGGLLLYAPNFNDDTVSVLTTNADGTLSSTTTIGSVGSTLLFTNVRQDQAFAYVSARSSNQLRVIDTATQTVIQTIATGKQPSEMIASPDGTRLYVANGGGGVSVFSADPITGMLTADTTIPTGGGSGNRSLTISPDGSRLYVVDQSLDRLLVIDTATNSVSATVTVGDQPLGAAISPDGSTVYVTNFTDSTVSIVNTTTNSVTATIGLDFGGTNGNGPDGVTASPDGKFVYVANRTTGNITVIDTTTNSTVGIISNGSQTNGVSLSPDGTHLYASSQGASDKVTAYSIDPSTGLLTSIGSTATGDSPLRASICGNGDSLLASGRTFVAKTGAALGCTGTSADFTGGTLLVSGSDLDFDTAVALGSAGGTVDTNGNNATISSVVSGSGGITKTGSGTLKLSGANTYTGATAVSAGVLQAGSTSAFGSNSAVSVSSGATLDLAGFSNTLGSLSGAGTVTSSAAGGVTLTTGGDNSSTTFSGTISDGSGTLALTKTGSGTMTLSGTNTYTGGTSILSGILSVNGSIGDVTINGGRLGGNGTVGNVTVNSGGTYAPGNSIGKSTVTGNVTFNSGSDYRVEVNDGGNAAGVNNDLISASGTATIDSNATVTVLAENGTDDGSTYADKTTYTILSATGGITGTFGTLTENFAFLSGQLSYAPRNVYLTLARNDQSLAGAAETTNQLNTATAVDNLGAGSSIYNALLFQSTSGARTAYDNLSGEIHASTTTVLAEDARFIRNAAYDRSRVVLNRAGLVDMGSDGEGGQTGTHGESASGPMNAPGAGNALWMTAVGGFGDWSATANTAKLSSSTGGFLAGFDGVIGDAYHLGVLGGYQKSNIDMDARASSATVDTYLMGLYGSARIAAVALRLGGSYAWHDIGSDRSVTIGAFTDNLSANYAGRSFQAFAETGLPLDVGGYALEPFAGLAHVNVHTDGFTESGGAAALTVNPSTTSVTFMTLGLRAGGSVDLGEAVARFHGGLAWQRALGPVDPSVQNSFAAGTDFTVRGTPIARDVLALDAALEFDVTDNASLGLAYDGYLSGDSSLHDVKARFSYRF